ncbi:MAG: M50 family metallopeptidase [Gemmatimonadaceae bacterium]|nr:M50 family metallopeptidase [Gemmatimonadaceae bacterium]
MTLPNPSSPPNQTPLLPVPPDNAPIITGRSATWRTFALGALAGAGIGLLGIYVGRALARDSIAALLAPLPPGAAWRWGTALLAMFTALLVHELGHTIGGVSQKFRFMLLVVGPFRLYRRDQGAPIRLGLNTSLELAGGVAACLPLDDRDLVRRTKWMVIAGPLASIALTVLCALVLLTTQPAAWSAFVLITGAVSAGLTVATLIPMRNGNFVTDGKRFLQLHREGPEAQRDAAQLSLSVRIQSGARIESIPREQIAALLAPVDGSIMEFLGRTTAYTWLLAHGRVSEARAQLSRAAALGGGLPFNLTTFVAAEEAFVRAWYDRDADTARARLAPHAKAVEAVLPAYERARIAAALDAAAGRKAEAHAHISGALALLEQQPTPTGNALWTKDRLLEMQTVLIAA